MTEYIDGLLYVSLTFIRRLTYDIINKKRHQERIKAFIMYGLWKRDNHKNLCTVLPNIFTYIFEKVSVCIYEHSLHK